MTYIYEEHKYRYGIDGNTYYVWLTFEEKQEFESKYGIHLERWD